MGPMDVRLGAGRWKKLALLAALGLALAGAAFPKCSPEPPGRDDKRGRITPDTPSVPTPSSNGAGDGAGAGAEPPAPPVR